MKKKYLTSSAKKTINIGIELSKYLKAPQVIYLYGNIGTGKTTLTKGILYGLKFYGNITSPTYDLIKIYNLQNLIKVYHLDLYRINIPKELIWIDIETCFDTNIITIIEWPENGLGLLPEPDQKIYIKNDNSKNRIIEVI